MTDDGDGGGIVTSSLLAILNGLRLIFSILSLLSHD